MAYVNTPGIDNMGSTVDTDYLQVIDDWGQAFDVTPYANQSAVSAMENASAPNPVLHQEKPGVSPRIDNVDRAVDTDYLQVIDDWGQASDVTPYANQSAVSAVENTSAQNSVPHQEKPETSPYEDVHEPKEYEMLGRHSPQLPTVYDSIKWLEDYNFLLFCTHFIDISRVHLYHSCIIL